MDDVERLITEFGADHAGCETAWKLDVLLDFARIPDPRVMAFLLQVLGDRREHGTVRLNVLRWLRNGNLLPEQRPALAASLIELLSENSSENLRLQAALALGEFVDLASVPRALGALALNEGEPLEVRYAAFTSLERAGPSPGSLVTLRHLRGDDSLGQLAHHLLNAWDIP